MTRRRSTHGGAVARTSGHRAAPWATALALAALLAITSGCAVSRAEEAPAKTDWKPAFSDDFRRTQVLTETAKPETSSSDLWWLDSGAQLAVANGTASTILGEAPDGYLRRRYAQRNARDTEGGAHPQNLFRLVTRATWNTPVSQRCSFRVLDYHASASPQRGVANGLLLFSRYRDANNLYYAGIRVDGHAVVKKKSAGVYYTLAETPVFEGHYQREQAPTLLPREQWLTLRSEVTSGTGGSVLIDLYLAENDRPERLILRATDAGVGGAPFSGGRCGIRTDFMDVEFKDYAVSVPR